MKKQFAGMVSFWSME